MPEPEDTTVETQAETTQQAPATETVKGEPFDAARAMKTIEALRAEIKELKPKVKQAEELTLAEQKRKEAEMTELQKLQAKLDEATAELKRTRLTEMRRTAAETVGLPLAFAERLKGETPEELEADAKSLLEALPNAPKPPKVEPTNPGAGATVGETIEEQRKRIQGNTFDPLDPGWAKAHGGGIFLVQKGEE